MHKTAITMPKETWENVQYVARENGLTANAFMVQAVVKELNSFKFTKDFMDKMGDPDVMASMASKMGLSDKLEEIIASSYFKRK